MNFGKPIHITLLGSSVVGVLVFILLLLFDQIGSLDLGPFSLILIPLLVAGSVFILFTYLIARFINKKIKFIYGIINSKQIPDETESTLKEDDVKTWSEGDHKDLKKVFLVEMLGTFMMISALLQIKNTTNKLRPLS